MGGGYGEIYSGTFGGKLYGKALPLGLTAELPDERQVLAALVALAGIELVDIQAVPLTDEVFARVQAIAQSAAAIDALGELVGEPGVSEERLSGRIGEALADALARMIAARAAELGIDLTPEPENPRPGIYENCKFAEAALGSIFPGTVPGGDPSQPVPRFAFHEEEGGHFGVDDRAQLGATGARRVGGSRMPVYVMENCAEVGGATAAGWALFVALGRGGTPRPLRDNREGGSGGYKGFGVSCALSDGTSIVWRWETFTKSSPALEIRKVPTGIPVAAHKVHFYDGQSKHRK